MIETLMRTALENRLLAVALVVVIVGVGAVSVARLPMDAFPDVTSNQVEIVCDAPGMSPLEIEKFVTYPDRNRPCGACPGWTPCAPSPSTACRC